MAAVWTAANVASVVANLVRRTSIGGGGGG
jgi:hypothetical protein